jgi:ABC-type sugar transport system ATPase subunit
VKETVLHVQSLTMQFGGLKAVLDLELQVPKGSVFGMIGPNGAGKTTVFNMLTGVYQPTHGSIFGLGENLVGKKPYQIARAGVARTFQNIRLFKRMTVLENLLVGMESNPHTHRYARARGANIECFQIGSAPRYRRPIPSLWRSTETRDCSGTCHGCKAIIVGRACRWVESSGNPTTHEHYPTGAQ